MNLRFDGKTVAVSGAGHGFGRAIAESFAALGARVFGCAPEAASVPDIAMATVDLTDRVAAAAWIAGIEQSAGAPLDVLVNNAGGVAGQVYQPLETVSDADWDRIVAINLGAAFTLSRAAAAGMKRAGRGRIVNISSGSGLRHRQARRGRPDAPTRARTRPAWYHGQQRGAWAGHQQSRQPGAMGKLRVRQTEGDAGRDSPAPLGHAAGHRERRTVLRKPAGRFRQWPDPSGGRR
jgi:NAD(P)-dependent dehydrogenase (short-subunit alcohol dehydrogenase family)